jgi:AGZA family xanthine/uracil permease-like MFS transporter
LNWLHRFFNLEQDTVNIKNEIIAAITIYMSIAYIVFTIPVVLLNAFPGSFDAAGNVLADFVILESGITAGQMLTALTMAICLATSVGTIILAFYAQLPFVLAPSISLALFVTYSLCIGFGYSYFEALAAIFISGIIFLIMSLSGLRGYIIMALPSSLKHAITVGMGLFLTFTGLIKAKIILPNKYTLVEASLFNGSYINVCNTLLTIAAVVFICILMKKKVNGAIFIGKLACIAIAVILGIAPSVSLSDFTGGYSVAPVFMEMDFEGLALIGGDLKQTLGRLITAVFGLTYVMMFDSMGTMIGTGYSVGLLDRNLRFHKLKRAMVSDSAATIAGACIGAPGVALRAESLAGVAEEGKTGITALIVGILFFFTSFLAPLAQAIPPAATAATLIVVGALLTKQIKYIDFEDIVDSIPAFLTIIMIPLTYSIAVGVATGIISYTLISIFSSDKKDLNWVTYILAALSLVYFLLIKI